MTTALFLGDLLAAPVQRQTSAGSRFATATVRTGAGSKSVLTGLATFSESTVDKLLGLKKGDSLASTGLLALKAWPEQLQLAGRVDVSAARNERLQRQADVAGFTYGERPVIAAGSTGSIPATVALLEAIGKLPRGALALQGLDTSFTPDRHERMLGGDTTQGHPQYGLMKLLRRLGAGIGEVIELGHGGTSATLGDLVSCESHVV